MTFSRFIIAGKSSLLELSGDSKREKKSNMVGSVHVWNIGRSYRGEDDCK